MLTLLCIASILILHLLNAPLSSVYILRKLRQLLSPPESLLDLSIASKELLVVFETGCGEIYHYIRRASYGLPRAIEANCHSKRQATVHLRIEANHEHAYGYGPTTVEPIVSAIMNLSLPLRPANRRNDESRSHFTNYTPTSSTEAIAGPVRELAPPNDRLIVGLDFGTTYSG